MIHDYELCIQCVDSLDLVESENLSKRGKYIKAEALTCKGI